MNPTTDTRAKTLQVRLRPAEYQTLAELAAKDDEPVSAVVRRAIRRYVEDTEGTGHRKQRSARDGTS
jgi:predicted DNA-binding protein